LFPQDLEYTIIHKKSRLFFIFSKKFALLGKRD